MKRPTTFVFAALLFAVTIAVFSRSVQADFVNWDDDINILTNPHIRGLTLENWKWIWTDTSYIRRYVPLGWLGWAVQFQAFGMNPWSWHLGNIVLHALNSVLVFFLIRALLQLAVPKDGSLPDATSWCAAIGALIWAVHPLRVESVAWVSGRLYDQAGTFLFASLLCYLRVFNAPRKKLLLLTCSYFCFACSLLTYPIALFCVFLYPLFDLYPLRRISANAVRPGDSIRGILLEKIPLLLIAGAVLVLTLRARVQVSGLWEPPITLQEFGIAERMMQAFYVWACYLWKTAIPLGLAPIYTNLFTVNPSGPPFVLSLLILLAVSTALVWRRKEYPGLLAAWTAYLVILIPTLGLTEHPHFASDRYSFLPAIAMSVCISAGLLKISGRLPNWRWFVWGSAAWLAVFGALTIHQLRIWRNSEVLFTYMLDRIGEHPHRHQIHFRLALLYSARDEDRKAVEQYHLCLAARPETITALLNLSLLLITSDDPGVRNGTEALDCAQKACELTSNSDPQKLSILASALAECGRKSEACATLEKAQAIAKTKGNQGFVNQSMTLLDFYRDGKTLRDYLASRRELAHASRRASASEKATAQGKRL